MDGTISCLAPPSTLPTTTSFADAALARALHLSTMTMTMSCDSAASSSSDYSSSQLLHYAPPELVARRHNQQQVSRGRIAKRRRSRASKRAPTTYISTDPSNFRLMVQHITGVQQQAADPTMLLAADTTTTNPLLMTTPPPRDQDHHHQQEQPCFPTLDSWNVTSMYETGNDIMLL